MATPQKVYPNLPTVSPLVGFKRKAGSGVVISEEKENLFSTTKKYKVRADHPDLIKLQEAIEKECKIREGANKLLQLSKNNRQNMEASKSLFVSNMKILEHMKKVQQVQQELKAGVDIKDHNNEELEPCKAKIGITDIRIPLEWKEFELIKGKLDCKSGVFCLFRLGNQVMDTPTLVELDRSMVDISFPDTIIFPDKVGPDFTLIVEVYCSVPVTDSTSSTLNSSKDSTPMKVLKKIKKELSNDHFGSPLSTSVSSFSLSPYVSQLPTVNPTHNFALAGHTQFKLKDVIRTCYTYNLTVGAVGSSGTALSSSAGDQPLLPLWGQICCSLMAEPACASKPRSTGFINVQQMVSGYPAWLRQWCVLRQHHLRCWTYPEDVGRKMPANTIELTKEMTVDNAPRLTMRRPNTLLVKDHETDQELYLSFESKEERDRWSVVLRQAILDLKIWKDSTNYIIPKQSSKFYNTEENISSYSRSTAFSQYTPPTETVL